MNKAHQDLKEIREMMERSSRFLSLSGSAGIFIGVLAIAFALYATQKLGFSFTDQHNWNPWGKSWGDFLIGAFSLLVICLLVSAALTVRRTMKKGLKVWDKSTRNILMAIGLPMFAGACLILNSLMVENMQGFFAYTLLCYGLGLYGASRYTYKELRVMGMMMLLLGAFSVYKAEFGLLFWTTGFGLIHVAYGSVMYFRYER